MGVTDTYLLPWPELPELADGPDGFQDLALATEAAIGASQGGVIRTWNNYFANNQPSSGGAPLDANLGQVNFPSTAKTVIIMWSFTVDVATNGIHDFYGYFDDQQIFYQRMDARADPNTTDRQYVWMTALKDQSAGNHSVKARSWPAGGCVIATKAIIASVIALG